jgi:hypothetical protein
VTTYKFVDEPAQGYRFVDEPAAPSSTLPANAGLAKLLVGAAGLPMDALQTGYNLFKSGMGVAQHKLLGTEPPALTSGLPGTSADIEARLRATGMPGLSPDNPAPGSTLGTAQYELMSRGGAIPGGFLPAAGSMVAEKIGGPQWAGVGALTPQAGITAYNAARAPSLARQELQNAVRDQTIRQAREEGFVASPTALGGGTGTNILESIGGKAATGQQAAIRNQELTTNLARRHAGLPENSAISEGALEARRNALAAPYREVAAIDAEAARALETLRQTRFDSTNYFRHYDRSADPRSLTEGRRLSAEAERLEQYLEGIARQAGRPELVDELRAARRDIARTYDVERALNVGTGDVSAPILGRMTDQGRPLTGGLGVAGRFQQAFPSAMREGERVPQPGVSALNPVAAAGLGLGGYGTMGLPGAALAALPFARGPVRAGILSDTYQNAMLPSYQPAVNPAPNPQLLYQLGILSERR